MNTTMSESQEVAEEGVPFKTPNKCSSRENLIQTAEEAKTISEAKTIESTNER